MTPQRMEQWVWSLIYGGLLGASLGWFVAPHDGPWGELLVVAGAIAAAVGVALIVVRSRMRE